MDIFFTFKLIAQLEDAFKDHEQFIIFLQFLKL